MAGLFSSKKIRIVPGETLIFEIRPSFVVLFFSEIILIIAIILLMALFYFSGLASVWEYIIVGLVGVFVAFTVLLNWHFTIYRLTDKRVENRVGVFGSREEEIALDDVQAVDVDQTIIGTIFNFGTVLVKSAGAQREVDLTNVSNPKKIANRIEDLSICEYQKRGHIS